MKARSTSSALRVLHKLNGQSPELQHLIAQERTNLDVAHKIIELRTKAGLSQTELAAKVGTTQSVISRLEDADYEGHSLKMLQRIASALGRDVRISFPPKQQLEPA